jgi:nucleoside-diphosphate-sugar epimerase
MPVSPYAASKLAAESYALAYQRSFGLPTLAFRFFNVFGPLQPATHAYAAVVPAFVSAALAGTPLTVYGDGQQTRDFTFVDDVVEANVLAATSELPLGAVLNVAGGSHTSVNEVLQIFEELAGARLCVTRGNAVAGDVRRTGGDTAAIRSALGWRPTVSLRKGIARQLDWAAELVASRSHTARA